MSTQTHPVDKILTRWRCSTCGETSECHVSDLTESGIPICGECADDMEPAPLAVLENPIPGPSATTPDGVRLFDSLNQVDWDLLYDQKLALIECLGSRQVAPSSVEALRGIIELLDALQDDAEEAGRWTHPDAEPS